jgi:hypothetical protein
MAKKPALRLGLIGPGFIGKNHTFGTAVVARVFDLPYEIATGRKMQHDFEIHGTKGALIFSHERFNELHFYSSADTAGRTGFRKIEAGPDQSPHGRFCVAPAISVGSTTSKRSRSRAISTPSPVSARNPSISGWVFAFRPSLRRSKNRGRQRAGWMSKWLTSCRDAGMHLGQPAGHKNCGVTRRGSARCELAGENFHNSWLTR